MVEQLIMSDTDVKQQVQEFYNQVGWQQVSAGTYQNATYEDLRPVSRQYIHRCHLRVLRHIKPQGQLFLDAGSGPIQYPEYLEYSRSYQKRVCLDISSVALKEAHQRIGVHGVFVVADIANLPFKSDAFDAVVSLHTIHHLPTNEHARAYQEIHRTLAPGCSAVIVNGWNLPPLTILQNFLIRVADSLRPKRPPFPLAKRPGERSNATTLAGNGADLRGTFIRKHTPTWLKKEVRKHMPVEIWCWRSVSVHFLRTFVHAQLGGHTLLRFLYWLEERFPRFFGENGQYPLIVIRKVEARTS